MIFLSILCALSSLYACAAAEYFSPEERDEARAFVGDCFAWLAHDQQRKLQSYNDELDEAEELEQKILYASHINYRKLNKVDEKIAALGKQLEQTELYRRSLERPKEKIAAWDEARESQARTLQAYISLSDEWQQFKKDPSNKQAYEALHVYMQDMARLLVANPSTHMFVAGSHAPPAVSDVLVNYDADRVFFLALYLLDKDLKLERSLAASSSSS